MRLTAYRQQDHEKCNSTAGFSFTFYKEHTVIATEEYRSTGTHAANEPKKIASWWEGASWREMKRA
jgi:hypothetical protein